MRAVFVELPAFARHRGEYLDDEGLRALQAALMDNPEAGEIVEGTGGLRKVRFRDAQRGEGRRGGLRVIYFWWAAGRQFWLFTIFAKGRISDLTALERRTLRTRIKAELEARRNR